MTIDRYLVKVEVLKSSSETINEIMNKLAIPGLKLRSDHHCTIVFAKEWKRELNENELWDYKGDNQCVEGVDQFGDAVVILLDDTNKFMNLARRRTTLGQEISAIEERDDYNPHVTLGYMVDQLDPNTKALIHGAFKRVLILFGIEKAKVFSTTSK